MTNELTLGRPRVRLFVPLLKSFSFKFLALVANTQLTFLSTYWSLTFGL